MLATVRLGVQQARNYTFSIESTVPPDTQVAGIMQRGDEVDAVQRMLTDAQASAVFLAGDAGVGKSTLAALLFHRIQTIVQSGWPGPRHFVWLRLGAHTTLPDLMAAILSGVNKSDPGFFLLKPEQQIAALLQALRRPQEPALIVLDQFEGLLHPETNQPLEGRGAIALFLAMLQENLGASRLLLTCYRSPCETQMLKETRVRSYLVSRMSMPEGTALLQQLGVTGSQEEVSFLWQRCGGHTFALVVTCALVRLSGLALSNLLNAPEHQSLWSGDVTYSLISLLHSNFNPIQRTLMRTLSLFTEPVPAQGLFTAIMGVNPTVTLPLFEEELLQLTQLALVQQTVNKQRETCFSVHSHLRQYITKHYLDEGNQQANGSTSMLLGVTSPLSLIKNDPEAQEVAVAAGHMRVAEYYQHLAKEQHLPREARTGPQDIHYLLEAVFHLCQGWYWQQACDLLLSEGIYESMVRWGAWYALIGLYMAMLPPQGVLTRRDEGLICNHLGLLYDRLDNPQQSWHFYEQALVVQRKIGDTHGEAITLTNQGELCRNQGELERARLNFEQARVLNKPQQDTLLESVLLHNLGLLHYAVKDYQSAMTYYQEALQFAQSLAEPYNTGMILTNMGVLLYEQGYHVEAVAVFIHTLQMRHTLQFATVIFIEQFLEMLEENLGPTAYAQLRQESRKMRKQVLSRLTGTNMRQ
jgi:tetratricopeptide (TPR) repeat protein